jgi:ubiquinone/menaquinone biosynthesis C-methylase UbiE
VSTSSPFDHIAEEYDQWYDTLEGAAILTAELGCLRMVVPQMRGIWLEIGVGTGRFAAALGITDGIDPSLSMLEIAAARGIRTKAGTAEELPYPAASFDGALMVAALCFVENVPRAFDECSRIIGPGGTLLIGHIPADGPWGRDYIRKAAAGHPIYSHAHFTTVAEVQKLARTAGFQLVMAASGLFKPPRSPVEIPPRVQPGIVAGAGFVALALRRATPGSFASVDARE